MPDDNNIPTGRPVELTPKNPLVAILIRAQRSGWTKRQATKLAALVAGWVSGWFAGHGGQEYAAEIGMGVAAVLIFLTEAAVSWLSFKFSQVQTVQALTMEKPETMKEAKEVVAEIAKKPEGPPPMGTIPALLLVAMLALGCQTKPGPYRPRVAALPVGPCGDTPPPWFSSVNEAITREMSKR